MDPVNAFEMIKGNACFAIPYIIQKIQDIKKISGVANERSFVCLVFHVLRTCGISIITLRLVAAYPKRSGLIIKSVYHNQKLTQF